MATTNNKKSPKDMTPEELEAERQKAMDQINMILDTNAPKNLGQGMTRGVSNIVTGCVGAAGVAVLAPTMGLAAGLRGGLLGGVVGVAGGAIVGVLGAAALAIGGVATGISQMLRGIGAIPASFTAPRQGKWWNENEGKWIFTNLENEQKGLEGIPDDDNDILGELKKDLDSKASVKEGEGGGAGAVKDMQYYNALEVPSDADQATIKRRYYVLARKYHPDKVGADDKEAAEKFKEVAEAYQVLSDPELREKYNKDGKDGLSADKTSTVEGGGLHDVDPYILFAFLFGSDQFNDYVGRLATATSASVGDAPDVSLADAKTLQKRRTTRLAIKLAAKVAPWVELAKEAGTAAGDAKADNAVEKEWKVEAEKLSKASYGHQMVTTIGKIYNLMAIMYEGTSDGGHGMPGVSKWAAAQRANMSKKADKKENKKQEFMAGLDMMKLQVEYGQKMQEAKTEEDKQRLQRELQDASVGILLRVLWTTTVVDITSTLYETANMVFYDQSVDAETRKQRAFAVKSLGAVWMECPPAPPGTTEGGGEEKDAKTLYEEAAFAAMLETVKRKDEAAHATPEE